MGIGARGGGGRLEEDSAFEEFPKFCWSAGAATSIPAIHNNEGHWATKLICSLDVFLEIIFLSFYLFLLYLTTTGEAANQSPESLSVIYPANDGYVETLRFFRFGMSWLFIISSTRDLVESICFSLLRHGRTCSDFSLRISVFVAGTHPEVLLKTPCFVGVTQLEMSQLLVKYICLLLQETRLEIVSRFCFLKHLVFTSWDVSVHQKYPFFVSTTQQEIVPRSANNYLLVAHSQMFKRLTSSPSAQPPDIKSGHQHTIRTLYDADCSNVWGWFRSRMLHLHGVRLR